MSAVQAHQVIKFRFIRLISILIKTLTPPSSHPLTPSKAPGTYSALMKRGRWIGRENGAREQETERGEIERNISSATAAAAAAARFTITALADTS